MKFISFLIFINTIGFSVEKINLPQDNYKDWQILQDDETWIEWTNFENYPICRAERILNHKIESISKAIEDKQNYTNIFDRITQVKLYEEDIIHIYLDMPFPISSRDYIVKYEFEEKDHKKIYNYYSVNHPNSIRFPDSIRLPNAGGKWILEPMQNDSTKVTYIWNGELLGDFPDWALTNAWILQGTEVLDWLNSALNRTKNK